MFSSSSSSSNFREPVPQGHVRLILVCKQISSLYLEIPLDIINSVCLKPLKYLVYLGWYILGVEGVLKSKPGGEEIGTEGALVAKMYYFVSDVATGSYS